MASVRTICLLFALIKIINCETLTVEISSSEYINLVNERFLSITVDPKFLFENASIGKDCICMASSLSPAYIRIAGPSTSALDYQNSSLLFDSSVNGDGRNAVDLDMWERFSDWAKSNNLIVVFALNNEVTNQKGLWDPQSALDIMTAAEDTNITDVVWQLGYECHNSTLDAYYSDLDTLRVILDTSFPRHKELGWEIAASDASGCLDPESHDFMQHAVDATKYVDAILFNGNATATEMRKLSPGQRVDILKRLVKTEASIWITDHRDYSSSEMEQATEWLADLGYCALSGFDVHFRELQKNELFEPTLSFYMSLLYKNLVGQRVLQVNMDGREIDAAFFAHCTTLKGNPVPGAVTLFGVNMDEQMTRFTIKLSKREEGGDILQFVISQDRNGNAVVNGYPMFHEGDIRPVVKRVRPFRTLLVSLPPKSFGFWVLANAKIEACLETNEVYDRAFVPATTVDDISDRMTITRKDLQRLRRRVSDMDIFSVNTLNHDEVTHENKHISENEEKRQLVNRMMNLKWDEVKFWKLTSELMKREMPLTSIDDLHRYLNELLIELYDLSSIQIIDNFLATNGLSKDLLSEKTSITQKQKHQSKDMPLKSIFNETINQISKSLLAKNINKQNTVSDVVLQPNIDTLPSHSKFQDKINLLNANNEEAKIISKKHNDVRAKLTDDIQSIGEMVDNARSKMIALVSKIITRTEKNAEVLKVIKQSTEYPETYSPIPALRLKRSVVVNPEITKNNIPITELNDTIKDVQEIQNLVLRELPQEINTKLGNDLKDLLKNIQFNSIEHNINDTNDPDNEIVHEDDLPEKDNEIHKESFNDDAETMEDQIIVKTKISDDDASISVDEKSNREGILKKVVGELPAVIDLLKGKLSRLWNMVADFDDDD